MRHLRAVLFHPLPSQTGSLRRTPFRVECNRAAVVRRPDPSLGGDADVVDRLRSLTEATHPAAQVLQEVSTLSLGEAGHGGTQTSSASSPGALPARGVPGVAKTLAVPPSPLWSAGPSTGSSSRPTWCRPTSSARASTGRRTEAFDVELGPVFANFVLADEINRAPAKVQSAMLEVMAEKQVSLAGRPIRCRTRSSSSPPRTPSSQRGLPAPGSAARPLPVRVPVDHPRAARRVRDPAPDEQSTPPRPTQVLNLSDLLRLRERPNRCK